MTDLPGSPPGTGWVSDPDGGSLSEQPAEADPFSSEFGDDFDPLAPSDNLRRRRLVDRLITFSQTGAALLAVALLAVVVYSIASHAASVLSFAMPFGLLGLVAAMMVGRPLVGVALLGFAVLNRVLMALVAGWAVAGDPYARRFCWLYPVRDLMGFAFWVCSFFGNIITWRGQQYRLELDGLMVPVSSSGEFVYRERLQVEASLATEQVL